MKKESYNDINNDNFRPFYLFLTLESYFKNAIICVKNHLKIIIFVLCSAVPIAVHIVFLIKVQVA